MTQKRIDKHVNSMPVKKKKSTPKKKKLEKNSDNKETLLTNIDEDIRTKFENILKTTKVFRDPVHEDIWITELEQKIIDHRLFQRLRKIKQLGPTFLVYPGAMHTRFEHSLGTLFLSQKIIVSIQSNVNIKKKLIGVYPEEIFVIRLIALMHDMAHISWGHTIEDEGNLIERHQWINDKRRKKIFEEILPIIEKYLKANSLERQAQEILDTIEETLIAEEVGEDDEPKEIDGKEVTLKGIDSLKLPFIADIVGNTVCADFLDYIKRDCYFSGLKMIYDPRIFSYFARCKCEDAKSRVCIPIEKRFSKIRWDILNYCVDLLRMRYDLAQKVYHHRVKRNFSAMVIKMVYCALKSELLTEDDLFEYGDDVIPYFILNRSDLDTINNNGELKLLKSASQNLARSFIERKIYDIIYETRYIESSQRIHLEDTYNDPLNRYKTETIIEELYKIAPGSIIIYASKLNEGKKALVKMCKWNNKGSPILLSLKRLAKSGNEFRTIKSQLNTLKELYQDMWKFFVIIDRDTYNSISKKVELKAFIEKICNEDVTEVIDDIVNILSKQEPFKNKILVDEIEKMQELVREQIELDHYATTENIEELMNPIRVIKKIMTEYITNKNGE